MHMGNCLPQVGLRQQHAGTAPTPPLPHCHPPGVPGWGHCPQPNQATAPQTGQLLKQVLLRWYRSQVQLLTGLVTAGFEILA